MLDWVLCGIENALEMSDYNKKEVFMDKLLKSFQGIEGFITRKFEIIKDELYWEIECSKENFSCSCCDSENVTPTFIHHREVKCLPMGF